MIVQVSNQAQQIAEVKVINKTIIPNKAVSNNHITETTEEIIEIEI